MRPVERGAAPRVYTNYQDAGPDLQARLGDYCSYCERQIETNLAVEHVQPKDPVPALRNEWTNFLLGCGNCNSSKGATPVVVADYLWPDLDNTLLAFEYGTGGIVSPSPQVPAPIQAKAQQSILLTGLDKDPGNPNVRRRPTSSDKRWHRRFEAWQLAEKSRQRLAQNNTPELREQIIETALARGMFSIWYHAFVGDLDMRRRLRMAFMGTAFVCFDPNEDPLPRPGGQV
jgi:uncharacterized protein (TIGR02646 family)